MNLGTTIYTWFYGNIVAEDKFGNRYYCNSKNFDDLKAKRWVIFKGEVEATKIPPQWHSWLHKSIDKAPINYSHKYEWQKDHEPNRTGTEKAFSPNSELSENSNYDNINEDYEKWNP